MAEINLYKTRTMLGAIKNIPSNEQFLMNTFCKRSRTFPTESFDIDFVKGKKKLAPFVAKYKNGVMVERNQITTKNYTPEKIQPMRALTVDTLEQRLAGEAVYSDKKPADRKAELLAGDLRDLKDFVDRRKEWIISQIITTGGFSAPVMADNGVFDTVSFDYGHTQNESKSWADPETSKPLDDLQEMYDTVGDGCGEYPTIVLMGATALKNFMASKQVLEALDKRNFTIGMIEPSVRSKHVQFIGKLLRPNVEIYTYAESYVDDEGVTAKFIPDNKVVVACDDIFEMNYGAVTQMESGDFATYEGELVPKYWVNEGDDIANVRVTSKPIPVPFDVNAWAILDVE
jgi:hypothetical protein